MIKFDISIGVDLQIIDHQINIKRSEEHPETNAFELRENGIFMDDRIVTSGTGFANQQADIVRIGFFGPYDTPVSGYRQGAGGRISANCIVHRIFTAKDSTGTTIENFRAIDSIIPGDMLRIPKEDGKYEYRLIIKTTSTDDRNRNPQQTYGMNNAIAPNGTVVLGTW
jgi:hypothetical protein